MGSLEGRSTKFPCITGNEQKGNEVKKSWLWEIYCFLSAREITSILPEIVTEWQFKSTTNYWRHQTIRPIKFSRASNRTNFHIVFLTGYLAYDHCFSSLVKISWPKPIIKLYFFLNSLSREAHTEWRQEGRRTALSISRAEYKWSYAAELVARDKPSKQTKQCLDTEVTRRIQRGLGKHIKQLTQCSVCHWMKDHNTYHKHSHKHISVCLLKAHICFLSDEDKVQGVTLSSAVLQQSHTHKHSHTHTPTHSETFVCISHGNNCLSMRLKKRFAIFCIQNVCLCHRKARAGDSFIGLSSEGGVTLLRLKTVCMENELQHIDYSPTQMIQYISLHNTPSKLKNTAFA